MSQCSGPLFCEAGFLYLTCAAVGSRSIEDKCWMSGIYSGVTRDIACAAGDVLDSRGLVVKFMYEFSYEFQYSALYCW